MFARRQFRFFAALVIIQLLLLIILATRSDMFPPSPPPLPAPFAHADQLFGEGRYFAAWQEYRQLAEQEALPRAERLLRMGMILTVRGAYGEAARKLHAALGAGLPTESANLALLYLGQCSWAQGLADEAERAWARLHRPSPLEGVGLVLRAEWALQQGRAEIASATYTAALERTLPADWMPTVIYRVALLQATHDPDTARASLQMLASWQQTCGASQGCFPPSVSTVAVSEPLPLIRPLIPRVPQDISPLLTILSTPAPEYYQRLGQYFLAQGWHRLALEQFEQIDEHSPDDLRVLASAYAGYTRWYLGEKSAGIQAVRDLARIAPENPHLHILLVLMLSRGDESDDQVSDGVLGELDALVSQHPTWPETFLVHAHRALRQHDYATAMRAFHQALALVVEPPERRGRYALLVARFHLTTTYGLCEYGLPAAEQASQLLRNHVQAWNTLAAVRYHCRSFVEAAVAARIARAWGGGAEASYYLGAALLELAQRDEAKEMLIEAADAAPASPWRARAERKLASLMPLEQAGGLGAN